MNPSVSRGVGALSVLLLGALLGVGGSIVAYTLSVDRRDTKPATLVNAATSVLPASPDSTASEPESSSRLTESEFRLAAALARIDQLYDERERDWQQTADWVETLLDSRKTESSASNVALERLRRKLEIRKRAEEGQLLGGLDDSLMLIFATLLAGEEAIEDLRAVVEDPTLNLEMRKEAFATLGYLPSELALETTLNPPEDLAAIEEFTLDQQLSKLALLADFLPPDSIAPHSETMYGVAVRSLDANPEDREAWKLVAALAWEHQHRAALDMLNDPRNTRFLGDELLRIAWWSATDGGRDYIERMSRTHPSPETRRMAADILAGWSLP